MSKQAHLRPGASLLMVGLIILLLALMACGGLGQSANVEATVAAAVEATRQAETNTQTLIDTAIAATQQAEQGQQTEQPTPPPTRPPNSAQDSISANPVLTPTPAQIESIHTPIAPPLNLVRETIINEIKAIESQNLNLIQSLYTPGAIIVDFGGDADDASTTFIWNGRPEIEQRYRDIFVNGPDAITLMDLSIQADDNLALATYQGLLLDGTLYPDSGAYTLQNAGGTWLITRLEYGTQPGYAPLPPRDSGVYVLELGNQHRYEEPWGSDRGDPCLAWETNNFDDTQPNHRGFNVELLLTNNSEADLPNEWPVTFETANGKLVKACQYVYDGAGPAPATTASSTFFTVVQQGDYVETITFNYNGQIIKLCLDGEGGSRRC